MTVSYGGSNITFDDGSTVSSGWTGFKNRLINGAVTIDQRYSGASANNITGNIYIMDRWCFNGQVSDKYSARMVSTANSAASNFESGAAPAGFTNSIKITTVSANTTVTNTLFAPFQCIEGFNVADLAWGTSAAQPLTVSFWTKSSITGSYSLAAVNGNQTRTYATTYTINQANTWEYKTVTIPGDQSGTWWTDNRQGIYLFWGLGAGTLYSVTTNNTWETNGGKYHATGTTKFVETLGATKYLTGLQAERGSTASSFEYRPYTTESQLCKRYYYQVSNWYIPAGANAVLATLHPVSMRVTATIGGGGSGFALASNNTEVFFPYQSTGAYTTLSASAEL